MTRKQQISGGQWFCLLFAGRLSHALWLSADDVYALSIPQLCAVTVINAAVLLLLALPTYLALRHTQHTAVGSRAAAVIYGGFALFAVGFELLQFTEFAQQTVRAELSVFVLAAAVALTCVAAAVYGIQALGRASFVIAFVSVLIVLMFAVVLVPHMRALHLPPANGVNLVWRHVWRGLPRHMEVVALGAVLPYVRRKPFGGYCGFVAANGVFELLVCGITLAVLGDAAGMGAYPFYTAVSAANVGIAGSLALPMIVLWIGTFFVRISLFCWVWLEQAQAVYGERARTPAAGVAAAVLLLVIVCLQRGVADSVRAVLTMVCGAGVIALAWGVPLLAKRRRA